MATVISMEDFRKSAAMVGSDNDADGWTDGDDSGCEDAWDNAEDGADSSDPWDELHGKVTARA